MSDPDFQCYLDDRGDIYVSAGKVICLTDGAHYTVGETTLPAPPAIDRDERRDGYRALRRRIGKTLIGGSGNNVTATPAITNTLCPQGIFRPVTDDDWKGAGFPDATIVLNGDGSADIDDGTDVLASIAASTSTLAPYGTFAATTYGETTYNGGTAFDIEVGYEGGGSLPDAVVSATDGTMQVGVFSATSPQVYVSDDDSDWTITISDDGSAIIEDGTDTVAERAATEEASADPRGVFAATAYGQTTYNDDHDFQVSVDRLPVDPIVGVVYLHVVEASAGVISTVSGPLFAATLPASSDPNYYVPIAEISAAGMEQIIDEPIFWS